MSTIKFNQWLNSDNTENYKCRAWVNFNGTGTVAIRAAGNVSSITDNGAGDYTVNFTNAMPDANYGMLATCSGATGSVFNNWIAGLKGTAVPTALAGPISATNGGSSTLADVPLVMAAFFR